MQHADVACNLQTLANALHMPRASTFWPKCLFQLAQVISFSFQEQSHIFCKSGVCELSADFCLFCQNGHFHTEQGRQLLQLQHTYKYFQESRLSQFWNSEDPRFCRPWGPYEQHREAGWWNKCVPWAMLYLLSSGSVSLRHVLFVDDDVFFSPAPTCFCVFVIHRCQAYWRQTIARNPGIQGWEIVLLAAIESLSLPMFLWLSSTCIVVCLNVLYPVCWMAYNTFASISFWPEPKCTFFIRGFIIQGMNALEEEHWQSNLIMQENLLEFCSVHSMNIAFFGNLHCIHCMRRFILASSRFRMWV